jgi:rod shape-determining protein MreB
MFGLKNRQFGIDLGTTNIVIYQKGKGIVLNEPSVVALHTNTREIVAIGEQARVMVGRTSDAIEVIHPIQDGVIADFVLTATMLEHFLKKLIGKSKRFFQQPHVVISVPYDITSVKRRAIEQTAAQIKAAKVTTIEEPLAAAFGAGLPVDEPVGSMVVDIGGGTTQVAILSLGGLVAGNTVHKAGLSLDADIIEHMKSKHNLDIGLPTAEHIKHTIGSAIEPAADHKMDIRGRDFVLGLPKTVTIYALEIHDLLNDFIGTIVESIRKCLEKCPPELVGDIVERGVMLCGGGALLQGLDRRLQNETQIPVYLAEKPTECIALGAGKLLYPPNFRKSQSPVSG